MHEKNMSDGCNQMSAVSTVISAEDKTTGVASLWNDVVFRLEQSVEADLNSADVERTLRSIKLVRRFVVASTTNKSVVGNSKVLRPRLLELLGELQHWSVRRTDLCQELCALVNSLVRDSPTFTAHILANPELPSQLISVIISPESEITLRETCLLLLRSLFGAEGLSSALSQTNPGCQRHAAALHLFTDSAIRSLMQLRYLPDATQQYPALTSNALCYLLQILALLATDPTLAASLHRLNAIQLCHEIIQDSQLAASRKSKSAVPHAPSSCQHTAQGSCSRMCCPTNVLAVRFVLKLLVHLFFHEESALDGFKKVYEGTEPRLLLACYDHLITSDFSSISSYPVSSESRHKRMKRFDSSSAARGTGDSCDTLSRHPDATAPPTPHISRSGGFPPAHGSQLFLGLLRGLIYWRMLNRSARQDVDALDQFGMRVASSTGLELTNDDVARLVIQPLTEACLYVEDIRILSWICHVLVLVLNRKSELHFWTVYTNSFIREVSSRVTVIINAVHGASDYHSHIQFLEHLIPLVKLFACLASTSEAIRVLFTEASMCTKLIEFTLRLKPLAPDHSNLVLEFQQAICVLLHVLSRSFNAHHAYFRHENTLNFLLRSVEEYLPSACRGNSLCAAIVEAASSALINVLLPRSPARDASDKIRQRTVDLFIRLIKATEQPNRAQSVSSSTGSADACSLSELTADLRPCRTFSSDQLRRTLASFRLNGIWGLANLLHASTAEFCSELFERLVAEGAWLELLRPVLPTVDVNSLHNRINLAQSSGARRVSLESGFNVDRSFMKTGDVSTSSFTSPNSRKHQRSESLPSIEPVASSCKGTVPIQTLLAYYTLMLLRNLLRHRKVIDLIVGEHWWNIAQLIISVLEGDYPQPVKEQGILVLAHIAIGQSALEQLHRNEDLTEKIKLFMRSPDNYTKAAALTATYNLLGLGREISENSILMDSTKQSFGPFFQPYHRRMPHRHRERSKRKHDAHADSSARSPPSESYRRDIITCVAQSALQETEEIEDEDEQDIVVDHGHVRADECSFVTPNPEPTCSSDVVICPSTQEPPLSSNPEHVTGSTSTSRRNLRTYRSWQASPESPNISEVKEPASVQSENEYVEAASADHRVSSSSNSSSFSGTSSASCPDELVDVNTQISELDRSTAQDIYTTSPIIVDAATQPSPDGTMCSNTEETEPSPIPPISLAPLASQEAMDDFEHSSPPLVAEPRSESQTLGHESLKTTSSPDQPEQSNQVACTTYPERSRRNWEVGFHHILLPFLKELESNQILRSTWDWLMLRASTRGRPIQLHQLLVAWQRLYDAIPSTNLSVAQSECSSLDSSLFTNCLTVNSFLQRLRDSSQSSSRSPGIRHCDSHHHHSRRRHHHCHRHQLRTQPRRASDRSVVTPSATGTVSQATTTEPEVPVEPLPPSIEPESNH